MRPGSHTCAVVIVWHVITAVHALVELSFCVLVLHFRGIPQCHISALQIGHGDSAGAVCHIRPAKTRLVFLCLRPPLLSLQERHEHTALSLADHSTVLPEFHKAASIDTKRLHLALLTVHCNGGKAGARTSVRELHQYINSIFTATS